MNLVDPTIPARKYLEPVRYVPAHGDGHLLPALLGPPVSTVQTTSSTVILVQLTFHTVFHSVGPVSAENM